MRTISATKRAYQSNKAGLVSSPTNPEVRLNELARLKDGWLNGKGRAINRNALNALARAFNKRFDRRLPLPHFYPTPEGGVQAEWTIGDCEISLEFTFPSLNAKFYAVRLFDKERKDPFLYQLNLDKDYNWKKLNELLSGVIGFFGAAS